MSVKCNEKVCHLNADGDKKVDMEEFLAVSAICAATSTQAGEMVKTKGGSVESLSAIFNLLDKDGSGVISKEELDQANQ